MPAEFLCNKIYNVIDLNCAESCRIIRGAEFLEDIRTVNCELRDYSVITILTIASFVCTHICVHA